MVAAALQPAVEKAQRQIAPAMGGEVHGEEGDVGLHVDPAQAGVELDAVERRDILAERHHVRQVQVAMAFAHPALAPARREARRQASALGFAPGAQIGQAAGAGRRLQAVQNLRRLRQDLRGIAVRRNVGGNGGGAMECGQPRCQTVDRRRDQGPGGQPFAQQRAGRELLHAQHVLDRLAGAVEHGHRGAAADRQHVEVDSCREPAIQAQFIVVGLVPGLQRREVEKTEPHGFLDLPGVFAVEQDPGNMRFETLHGASGRGLQKSAQAFDQGVGRAVAGGLGRRHGHGAIRLGPRQTGPCAQPWPRRGG
ncbi:hypothetical protein GALL_278800 [mine drainage metagenome]|uniref:Uncharacterized protein n=1 Tax=mine drainage metagenome TaxID=410659 RepID=A0A1J5R2T8_9ZZZZ